MSDLVRYEVRDRVAHVTITNGKANALAPDVIAGLDAALTRAEEAGDAEVGALLHHRHARHALGRLRPEVMRPAPRPRASSSPTAARCSAACSVPRCR